MPDESTPQNLWRRFADLNMPSLNFESILDLGFESLLLGIVGGLFFGFLIGIYPFFFSIMPFLPTTNILLFVAFSVPLIGSTHYDPKLGVLSGAVLLITARASQLLFGYAPYSQEFLVIAGVWAITQIFLIGYLSGRIIITSENFGYLFKGLFKVTIVYSIVEYAIWILGREALLTPGELLVFPIYSIPLLTIVSSITTFFFANTFCPYMMMPLLSNTVKGQRYCGAGNFIFKLGGSVNIDDSKIMKASRKGFKLISKLPSATVFSCHTGGIISVYHSGEILVRKVDKGTAERLNKTLAPIVVEA
jgi:hypothetical protein